MKPNFSRDDALATEDKAEIRLTGTAVVDHSVSAEVLVRTIEGIQQLAFLLGAAREEIEINQRFKLPAEIRKKYTLKCGVPLAGSYVLPLELKDSISSEGGLLGKVYELLKSIDNASPEGLRDLFPDTVLRARALTHLRQLLPRPGEDWELQYSSNGRAVHATSKFSERISSWIEKSSDEGTTMTIKGELVKIDFQARTVIISYRPTSKDIKCIYLPEVEEMLLQSRRELIEVTGQFTLDTRGAPTKLTDVFKIESVDLSPIQVSRFTWLEREFLLNPPLVLTPTLDEETRQLYVLTDRSFGIDVFAETRDHLVQELYEQIVFLWDTYADEAAERLSPDAYSVMLELKKLITRIK